MSEKIAVVMRLPHICERIRQVLTKYGYHYPVYELGLDSEYADSVLESLRQSGVKIIITGRSIPEKIVSELNLLHTPITRSRLTFIRVIEQALRDNDKVAIILNAGIYYDIAREVVPSYHGKVLLYKFQTSADLGSVLDKAVSLGVTAFIGTSLVLRLAEERHLLALEIPFEEDDILFAAKTAEYNLKVLENQLASDELIQAVWNNIPSGIVVFDQTDRITGANNTALRMLNCSPKELVGIPIQETVLQEFLTKDPSAEETHSQVAELYGNILAVTCNPVIIDGDRKMTLVLLEQIQQIQKMEQKIRHKLYHKGNMATVTFPNIVGNSAGIQETIREAKRFAAVDSSIVVYGETGTGKEMFVQSIHNASARQNYPFVAINCGALPENLLESLLFGYEKGAFTGATQNKRGLFEIAHQGTLFLDEIGEMPLQTQARFLRVLQEREVMPIGSDRVIPVDVRVIAATHRNLPEMVREGKFRADLFYRISVLSLTLPPLRERPEDIRALAQYHVLNMRRSLNEKVKTISPAALKYLTSLPLEGNVRQLFNLIERAIIISEESELTLETVRRSAAAFYPFGSQRPESDHDSAHPASGTAESTAVNSAREDAIRKALAACGNRKNQAAQILGISSSTLYRRMKELGIS